MKKIISSIALMAICATHAYAQDVSLNENSNPTNIENAIPDQQKEREIYKEKKKERMEKMSPEQRERMMKRKERFESLSPEKKEAVKTEIKRHRTEMKKITGEEMPEHPPVH